MKIIKQSAKMLMSEVAFDSYKKIELIGRVCYGSQDKITDNSYQGFIRGLINRGHESPLEHESFTFEIITDRAIANELERHRLCSFTQESTRYIKYNEVSVIASDKELENPNFVNYANCAELLYLDLLDDGLKAEIARDMLPLCTATKLYVTANLREWRHILKLRYVGTTGKPHPKMRELAGLILDEFKANYPLYVEDIEK